MCVFLEVYSFWLLMTLFSTKKNVILSFNLFHHFYFHFQILIIQLIFLFWEIKERITTNDFLFTGIFIICHFQFEIQLLLRASMVQKNYIGVANDLLKQINQVLSNDIVVRFIHVYTEANRCVWCNGKDELSPWSRTSSFWRMSGEIVSLNQ